MDYNFRDIEKKWRKYWSDNKSFKAENNSDKPKYYVLDMFPYPSGAGLHVGHPLGYIASDIYSRFKRMNGFNVLHPMGYDAYGLPAEQYAIQTGQHPAITTEKNIARYREQLDKIGFSFDWEREVRTCDPFYYKWTQWTFLQLFKSWYNKTTDKAEAVSSLISEFEKNGNAAVNAACSDTETFTAAQWKAMSEKEQQETLMNYRLAYLADTMVNWCPALGTVLANDEVSEGFSVRGGHPVERKKMRQWSLRITAYAERLLSGLDNIDWTDSIKEIQKNWIGKSEGAMIKFRIKGHENLFMEVFTTRPDTIFGVTYMTFAPEHEYVNIITAPDRKEAVEKYLAEAKNRSDRERMADVKRITGVFTGAYVINPITNKELPVWVGDYVLAGYGTGAVMAVPGHDARDWAFADHFKNDYPEIAPKEVVAGGDISVEAFESYDGKMINSGFLDGLTVTEAKIAATKKIIEMGIGYGKVNYRLRDAIFSRQRYWGEPFPMYYKDGIPYAMDESELPLELPEVDAYLPTESGEPPLARAKNWKTKDGYPIETNTMPGFAGSSAYYLRYMDAHNDKELVSKEANKYWENVDLYIGGAEHATGHLLYARFWNKFLFDLGLVCKDEPFKKLINQGMIQGKSCFVYRVMKSCIIDTKEGFDELYSIPDLYISKKYCNRETKKITDEITSQINIIAEEEATLLNKKFPNCNGKVFYDVNNIIPKRVPVEYAEWGGIDAANTVIIDTNALCENENEYKNARFIGDEEGVFLGDTEVEKMSKSYLNVVNPDELIERYGADTLRLYEMFLGPLEQHKPWDTKGIEGVFRFIRKLWKLCHNFENELSVSDDAPTKKELKVLHKAIKRVREDIKRFSFNTPVSTFMICVNELTELKCNKRAVLNDLTLLLAPYAPHIAEELWSLLGNKESITTATYPAFNPEFLTESNFTYPVSFNGKMRFTIELPVEMPPAEVEENVLQHKDSEKWLGGNKPKKVIVVPGKIVNIVC